MNIDINVIWTGSLFKILVHRVEPFSKLYLFVPLCLCCCDLYCFRVEMGMTTKANNIYVYVFWFLQADVSRVCVLCVRFCEKRVCARTHDDACKHAPWRNCVLMCLRVCVVVHLCICAFGHLGICVILYVCVCAPHL